MVVRPSRRGGRCRARAGRGCRARAGGGSGLRGGCCRRSGRGRPGRTGRASRGCAGMLVRGAPATSRGGSWPGRGYLSQAWPGAVALRRLPVIAGGGSPASERGGASPAITGQSDPCNGLTERDGPRHHDGRARPCPGFQRRGPAPENGGAGLSAAELPGGDRRGRGRLRSELPKRLMHRTADGGENSYGPRNHWLEPDRDQPEQIHAVGGQQPHLAHQPRRCDPAEDLGEPVPRRLKIVRR